MLDMMMFAELKFSLEKCYKVKLLDIIFGKIPL